LHPFFSVVVENHGFHRFIPINKGADPATKARAAAARGGGINNKGAFVIGGCASVDAKEFFVAMSPRVCPLV